MYSTSKGAANNTVKCDGAVHVHRYLALFTRSRFCSWLQQVYHSMLMLARISDTEPSLHMPQVKSWTNLTGR